MLTSSTNFDRPAGFALPDLLTAVAALSVLTAIVLVPLINARRKSRLAICTNNLAQIARALTLYANEKQSLPAGQALQSVDLWWSYKEQVKGYVGLSGPPSPSDRLFACPDDRGYSDPRPFAQTARFAYNSYPYNAITVAGAPNIAGWQLSSVKEPSKTLLVMEWCAHAPLSWHKSRTGKRNLPFYSGAESVVAFVDGHVKLSRIYYDGYNAAYTRDPIPGYDYKYSGN